jgi:hypothetical protein
MGADVMKPARFHGGPWNAATMSVDTRATIIKASEPDPPLIVVGHSPPPEPRLPRTGIYRQNPANAARYDWEGWQ